MAAAKKKTAKKAPSKKTTAKVPAKKAAAKAVKTAKKKAAPKATKTIKTPPKAMEKPMTKSKNQFEGMANDANAMGREGMDAIMKCGNIWMKGCEDMIQATTTLMQDTAQKQSQYMKEAMSAKTVNEFAETQNKIAQASYDDFMQGATKITELSVKLMTEASEPLNEQMTKTMHKASQTACA